MALSNQGQHIPLEASTAPILWNYVSPLLVVLNKYNLISVKNKIVI